MEGRKEGREGGKEGKKWFQMRGLAGEGGKEVEKVVSNERLGRGGREGGGKRKKNTGKDDKKALTHM